VSVFFGFALLGFIAGVAALTRSVDPTGSAWLALTLNILLAFVLYAMISFS
jgi:hypothetical protein